MIVITKREIKILLLQPYEYHCYSHYNVQVKRDILRTIEPSANHKSGYGEVDIRPTFSKKKSMRKSLDICLLHSWKFQHLYPVPESRQKCFCKFGRYFDLRLQFLPLFCKEPVTSLWEFKNFQFSFFLLPDRNSKIDEEKTIENIYTSWKIFSLNLTETLCNRFRGIKNCVISPDAMTCLSERVNGVEKIWQTSI